MRKKNEILNLANGITSIRLAGAMIMISMVPLTVPFYIVYTICGVSDAIDGAVARKMGIASEFGAKLDSLCDLVFYAVMLIKIMPILWVRLPKWIWIILSVVLIVRACAYTVAAIKYKKFAAIHTYANKMTGALVFLIPYYLLLPYEVALCTVTVLFALYASAEELGIHLISREYIGDVKTIIQKNKEKNI